ncbi:DsbA family protein [[Mycobacterium] kokjensenii]|uniref:DsbA family protein n=1 Tax=[Mycobacterium] kokjensenii TaxID=3064287 RepID=A0ABM9LKK8_9MYCO|nr:DsbA family protein [Mycolicibacter sp. MU0083]CAJ1500680.1 DsbA family protein [Mycolicibacter sp. MU0083]
MRAGDNKRNLATQIGLVAIVVVFAVGLLGWIVWNGKHGKVAADAGEGIRVTSSKLVTKDGTDEPKAVVTFYEDFLCPACGNLERAFGPTVSRLIDSGAIAADYHMVAIVSGRDDYSKRAGAAAYCVADESNDAFRRFHTALYTKELQPDEMDLSFPDNARLIELARQAGAGGTVPACINSGKYLKMVGGMVAASGIHGTPTLRINGEDYTPSTPEALVAKIREIVGDVPGMDAPAQGS